jgi:dTDP-4-dehydrorhamnose reductase
VTLVFPKETTVKKIDNIQQKSISSSNQIPWILVLCSIALIGLSTLIAIFLLQKKKTKIPKDQVSNPVWAEELARATLELAHAKHAGVFNVAGGKYLPRTEFARLIADIFRQDQNLIEEVETADLHQKTERPLRSGLRTDKLRAALGWAPKDPEKVLRELVRLAQRH